MCCDFLNRSDYIREAKKQLSNGTIYKDVIFNKSIIPNLKEKNNKIFENLKFRGFSN